MTDEQKVKAKYPDAEVAGVTGINGWCQIMTVNSRGGAALSERHEYESDAWADAAARIEASHE